MYLRFFVLPGDEDVLGELLLGEEDLGGGLGLDDLLGESPPRLLPPKFKRIEVPPLDLGEDGRGGDLGALLGDLGRGGEEGMMEKTLGQTVYLSQ